MIWLLRAFSVTALAALAAAVWYAGPLIGFADSRPLQPAWLRALIIGLIVAMVAGYYFIRFWQVRIARSALEAAASKANEGDSGVLEKRMSAAIATLRRASGKRNFLYEIPWYIIIGPPGAGKTTALVNSGLDFPLAGSGEIQPVEGIGGTRNCDWWFTDSAVLIDTAGRYTTHDSDPAIDKKGWLSFLSLLKKHRAEQPISGVILAISLADLMTFSGQELGAHIAEIRNRLQEIHAALKIDLPVYVLFTKADLVSGFMEYFGSFEEARRRKVWGATFQTADASIKIVNEAPAEFDALVRRLAEEVTNRLQDEADPIARISIFAFPAQFGSLKERIVDFLGNVFEPAREQANATLRGFYFSSGTQEGTPIDRLLGSIGRSFGNNLQAHLSGKGKSFFIHDLLTKVIFPEAGLVSHNRSADGRAALARYFAFGVIALVAAVVLGGLGWSFAANRALIASTELAIEQFRTTADTLLTSPTVADVDLENVIGALEILRNLPTGYASRELPTPIEQTLGLEQHGRLLSASENAYRHALERMFRPRLLLQLERTIEASMASPVTLYEPLKIYLMLGGKAPKVDDQLIVSWLMQDWEQNRYPGPRNRDGRVALDKHLRAMLVLDDAYDPLVELNRPLIESAQRSLGRLTVADRTAAMVASATTAAGLDDFSLSARGGPEAKLVFESMDGSEVSSLRVPGLYTYAGFNDFYLGQLAGIAQKLVDDQWVIGAGGEQGGVDLELLRLGPELLDRYSKDFAGAWNSVLDKLKFKAMSTDRPLYVALSAAASPASPLKQLFEAIAYETTLTRDPEAGADQTVAANADALRDGLSRIGIELAAGKLRNRAGAAFAAPQLQIPGANIEAQFRPFQVLVSGPPGQRPIDILVQNLHDIHQSLSLSASMPERTERVNANLQLKISNLRANASRMPKALSRMITAIADDFDGDVAETSVAQLNRMLEDTVRAPCDELIANRFPFAVGGPEEAPIEDFAQVFGPNGILDRFFAQHLASLADVSGSNWEWKQDTLLGRELDKPSLKSFQLAAEIRNAFFPLGGSLPAVNITFTPFSLHGDADRALLDVNGQVVESFQTGNTPGTVTWPGSVSPGSVILSLAPDLPGRGSAIAFDGHWAIKRLLDTAAISRSGDNLEARFVIGGRDVAYTIKFGSHHNPFSLPALSSFSCPTKL